MSCRLKGYAAHAPTDRLRLFQFDRRSPRPATLVHNRSSKIGDQPQGAKIKVSNSVLYDALPEA